MHADMHMHIKSAFPPWTTTGGTGASTCSSFSRLLMVAAQNGSVIQEMVCRTAWGDAADPRSPDHQQLVGRAIFHSA